MDQPPQAANPPLTVVSTTKPPAPGRRTNERTLMFHTLRRPAGFYKRLVLLALPLMLQNLITTSLAFVDTFMVGLVGDAELSAVTAANAPIFLLQVIIFGLMSSLTVLVSQYWGRGDRDAINRTMGATLYTGVLLSGLAALLLFFYPTQVMSIVTNNADLVAIGAPYLKIVGVSYVFNAASSVYVSMQRSTENPLFGMLVFGASMLLNTFLNYVLIFGHLGAPRLGVIGAALATLTSRVIELLIVLVYSLVNKRIPLEPGNIFLPGWDTFRVYLKNAAPILLNETMWGLGTTMMTVIMGHMLISADMLAAFAIMGNIDKFTTVSCFGLAGASAVMVGKRIGEGADREEVYSLSACLLLVAFFLGLFLAAALTIALPLFFIPLLYPLFSLSETAMSAAIWLCIAYIVTFPLKSYDISNITGILRAGGDAAMGSVIDLVPLWLFAVPLAAVLGVALNAPLPLVCFAIYSENFIKMPWGVVRLRSRKWIHDLTRRDHP